MHSHVFHESTPQDSFDDDVESLKKQPQPIEGGDYHVDQLVDDFSRLPFEKGGGT